mmetsp:Transcript_41432/g.119311  ORF Transcript_41432/g.119311 Transcript_41432/m.119311 type:complete len:475 (+) Transcript_41432:168-1592(+)
MSSLRAWMDQVLLLDLPMSRRLSYLSFAGALLAALGSQQFIAPVKVAIFMDVVGQDIEPVAKSLLLVVMVPILIAYNIVVSYLKSPTRIVFAVCGFYGAVYFLVTGVLLQSAGQPPAWAAWLLYYATDTKSVIFMPMIWSVLADVTSSDVAKKVYPVLFFLCQVGGVAGSLVAVKVSSLGGEVGLLLMQTLSFLLIAALTRLGCRLLDDSEAEERRNWTSYAAIEAPRNSDARVGTAADCQTDTGATSVFGLLGAQLYQGFEGIWLLCTKPYVFGAFWVSYASLMPRTMLDYQNSVAGTTSITSRNDQIAFFGGVNMMINIGTGLLALFGVRPIVEYFGVGFCLLFLPVGMFLCVAALCLHYSLSMTTISLVTVCILAYGLNSPCKEMLYVRTSKDIKYKAKSWSEMYGNQIMKVFGAQVNLWVNREAASCRPHCFNPQATLAVTLAWVVLWLGIAHRTGSEHRRLEKEDGIVS